MLNARFQIIEEVIMDADVKDTALKIETGEPFDWEKSGRFLIRLYAGLALLLAVVVFISGTILTGPGV